MNAKQWYQREYMGMKPLWFRTKMASITCTQINLSPISCFSTSSYPKFSAKQARAALLEAHSDFLLRFSSRRHGRASRISPVLRRRGFRVASFFNSGDKPKPNGDSQEKRSTTLDYVLPQIGSSSRRTAWLLLVSAVFSPIFEEIVFRGFLLTFLTKWVSTPLAITISAAAFALAHLSPDQFPQLYIIGTIFGFLYARTGNLLIPITIHALWNTVVILSLTYLRAKGYDLKAFVQKGILTRGKPT